MRHCKGRGQVEEGSMSDEEAGGWRDEDGNSRPVGSGGGGTRRGW